MAAGIATGFVRKLYRILDLESDAVISWDASGASFSIHDADALNTNVLPKYFRGRLCAFRQQLVDHGFEQLECEDNETREAYRHEHFVKGRPAQLSLIARVPKPKRRAQQQPPPSVTVTIANGTNANGNGNSMMPALIQVKQPQSRSLTVTLNAGVKRLSPSASSQSQQQKRMRGDQQQQQQSSLMVTAKLNNNNNRTTVNGTTRSSINTNVNSNPLFSNESDSSPLSFARLAESGLLPHSSDLPEPISYLARSFQANSNVRNNGTTPPGQAATQAYARLTDPPMFSDDLFRSALIFLTSTSTTGVEPPATGTSSASSSNGSLDNNVNMTVPSNLLSMLLASSTSGMLPGTSTNSGWGGLSGVSSNPLFSDQSTGDDDEDQDSIWNLLVASSVDRVKSVIGDLDTPQERLKVILAERERLEEQRKKFSRANNTINIGSGGVKTNPSNSTVAPKKSTNPLFAKPTPVATTATTSSANPLFAKSESKNPLFTKVSSVFSQNPLFAKPAPKPITTTNTSQPQNSNPLFAKSTKTASTTGNANSNIVMLGGRGGDAGDGSAPNEDDLWRLLMSSSIDSFRRIGEFEV